MTADYQEDSHRTKSIEITVAAQYRKIRTSTSRSQPAVIQREGCGQVSGTGHSINLAAGCLAPQKRQHE